MKFDGGGKFFLSMNFEYAIALSLEFTANTDDLKTTCTTSILVPKSSV